tara:strand:+ start:398 stop:865 length:468 start_codon:yes stop_codon:yes gene_type:complete
VKTITLLLLFFLIVLSACEKDDFCIQNPVTSKLIIRFYDDTNRETKKRVQDLSIFSDINSDTIPRYKIVNTDSIAIPLNSNALETVYNFSKGNIINKFTIKYDIEEVYISRSCGYKVVFKNVEFSSASGSWITAFTPTTIINLDDQSKAHVQIFH